MKRLFRMSPRWMMEESQLRLNQVVRVQLRIPITLILDITSSEQHVSLDTIQPKTQWCAHCRVPPPAQPLAQHVRCEPCAPRKRNRVEPLRWCDGAFRCDTCKVQDRRLDRFKRKCSDPKGHVPHARRDAHLRLRQVVHFKPMLGPVPQGLKSACSVGGCSLCT